MMNLEDIRIKVFNEANKDIRGSITPTMFNNALLFAEISVIAERLGLPEGYVPGKATGQEAYPLTAKVEDDLRPYLKSVPLTLDGNGRSPLPPDYLRRSSVDSEYKWTVSVPVQSLDCDDVSKGPSLVNNSKMVNVEVMFNRNYSIKKFHSYKFPTGEFPICAFYDFGIEVAPSTIKTVQFDYISLPIGALWAYTSPDGDPVYDDANSRQLQCPQDLYPKISSYVLRYVAKNLGDDATAAYADSNYKSGL